MTSKGMFKARSRRRNAGRGGAILLDLFLATVLFVSAAVVLGEFGSRTLKLAKTNGIERIAAIVAESVLSKEIAIGAPHAERTWIESNHGVPLEVRTQWIDTELPNLKRVDALVTSLAGSPSKRDSITLYRWVEVREAQR